MRERYKVTNPRVATEVTKGSLSRVKDGRGEVDVDGNGASWLAFDSKLLHNASPFLYMRNLEAFLHPVVRPHDTRANTRRSGRNATVNSRERFIIRVS